MKVIKGNKEKKEKGKNAEVIQAEKELKNAHSSMKNNRCTETINEWKKCKALLGKINRKAVLVKTIENEEELCSAYAFDQKKCLK